MRRFLLAAAVLAAMAGCAAKSPYADDATISKVAYRDPGQPALTLYTMVNNRTGSGAHTSLMISASQRVIFDPAGSFKADIVPERNDVLFGITPAVEKAYRSGHARSTHHVIVQTLPVTAEQAEIAYQLALQAGPVPGALCSRSTSDLLRQVPGLGGLKGALFPHRLAEEFGQIPGVVTERYYENDSADLQEGLAKNNAALNQAAASE